MQTLVTNETPAQWNAELDLTRKYADVSEIRAALRLSEEGWAYAIDNCGDTACVFAMRVGGSSLHGGNFNLTLVRTLDECVNELAKLVGANDR